ncbi:MAG: hypothetical protein JNN31_05565 [Dechloromonas sp.]|nr:hypothetical protein [Dechloromonas sp.]
MAAVSLMAAADAFDGTNVNFSLRIVSCGQLQLKYRNKSYCVALELTKSVDTNESHIATKY